MPSFARELYREFVMVSERGEKGPQDERNADRGR